jgi:hypothetical protein
VHDGPDPRAGDPAEHRRADDGDHEPAGKAERAPDRRHGHRLDEELHLDVATARTDCLPDADLTRPLHHRGEQHVHNADPADGEDQRREEPEQQLRQQHRLSGVVQSLRADDDVELLDAAAVALGEPVHHLGLQRVHGLDAARLETQRRHARRGRRLEQRLAATQWRERHHVGLVPSRRRLQHAEHLASLGADTDRSPHQPQRIVHSGELRRRAMAQHDDGRAARLFSHGEEAPAREAQSREVGETRRSERELHRGARAEQLGLGSAVERERVPSHARHFGLRALRVLERELGIPVHRHRAAADTRHRARRHRDVLHAALTRDQRSRPHLHSVGDRERRHERGDPDDHSRRREHRAQRIRTQRIGTHPCGFEEGSELERGRHEGPTRAGLAWFCRVLPRN